MITAIIITKNEEKLIRPCLESIKWVDEIVIADSGSTDKTLEIAREYKAVIFECKGDNFADWRNESLEKARGDWIFYIDSDERMLLNLRDELAQIVQSERNEVAWAVPRKNVILGELKQYGSFWPDYVIRLFKKERLKRWEGRIHEQPVFDGKLGHLKNPLLHLTHRDIDSMLLKTLKYEQETAMLRFKAGHPPMTGWRFLRILITGIWQQGIVKGAFFNGAVGVIDSLLQIFSLYISYVKLWELQRGKTLEKTYEDLDKDLIKNDFKFEK